MLSPQMFLFSVRSMIKTLKVKLAESIVTKDADAAALVIKQHLKTNKNELRLIQVELPDGTRAAALCSLPPGLPTLTDVATF